jgi:metal-sulfur cluster biosynthetic enzyme
MAFEPSISPSLQPCLEQVLDPEIGINIVDLGLVYLARERDRHIEVQMTLTSRACPMGRLVVDEVRDRIASCFPEAATVNIELVWDPAWTSDFINNAGRRALGRTPKGTF